MFTPPYSGDVPNLMGRCQAPSYAHDASSCHVSGWSLPGAPLLHAGRRVGCLRLPFSLRLTRERSSLLASIRTELERRLHTEIADWEIAPAHVSIFGSAARGDGDTRSDIDMFVVRAVDVAEDDPGWRDQLGRLADVVYDWTGNHAALSEVSAADIRRLRRERPPVIDELR